MFEKFTQIFDKLKKEYSEGCPLIFYSIVFIIITVSVFFGLFVLFLIYNWNVVLTTMQFQNILNTFFDFDKNYLHFESNSSLLKMTYYDRWLNYIPIVFLSITILSFIKTLITGKCCILKGLKFDQVIKFNIEIAMFCLIPYYLMIFIVSAFVFIIVFWCFVLCKKICDLVENIIDKYNDVCDDNNKKEENTKTNISEKTPVLIEYQNIISNEKFKVELFDNDFTYGQAIIISKNITEDKLKEEVNNLNKNGYICVYEGKNGYTFKKLL